VLDQESAALADGTDRSLDPVVDAVQGLGGGAGSEPLEGVEVDAGHVGVTPFLGLLGRHRERPVGLECCFAGGAGPGGLGLDGGGRRGHVLSVSAELHLPGRI
jgi:hypothetical protein